MRDVQYLVAMDQDITSSGDVRVQRLTKEECRDIYERYFLCNETMEFIASELNRTRLTISRCLLAQRKALEEIRPDLVSVRHPKPHIHYARYTDAVIEATTKQPHSRQPREATAIAEHFIVEWWKRQKREAKSKRHLNPKKLYQKYQTDHHESSLVSYKTFTRLIQRIVIEELRPVTDKPIRRATPNLPNQKED